MTDTNTKQHRARLQRERRRRLARSGHVRLDVTIPAHVWERFCPMFSEDSRSYPGAAVAGLLEQIADGRLPRRREP